jgi:hypothetical protein
MGDGHLLPPAEADGDLYLLHEPSGRRFSLSAVERDDEIVRPFADSGRVTAGEVNALRKHQVKVFISGPGGSIEAARTFLAIGAAFIRAGALAVMVDNCGNCHCPRDWMDLASDEGMAECTGRLFR